jgi:hypothetical protein
MFEPDTYNAGAFVPGVDIVLVMLTLRKTTPDDFWVLKETTPLAAAPTMLTWLFAKLLAVGPAIVTVCVPWITTVSLYKPALMLTVGTALFWAAAIAALMAVNSADPSSATVTAVALLVLDDATVEEVAEVVTEEILDEGEDAAAEETLDEGEAVVAEETLDDEEAAVDGVPSDEGEDVVDGVPSDEGEDVVEVCTVGYPDRSVEVPDCAVARPMRPTTPMMSERIVVKEGKDVANSRNSKAVWGQRSIINPTKMWPRWNLQLNLHAVSR